MADPTHQADDKATHLPPEEALTQSQFQMAVSHHQAGHLPQAEELYRQVLLAAPHHADALYLLGFLHSQQGQLTSAIDLLGKAINADPTRGNFYFTLGNVLHAQGMLDGAAASYRQALLLMPDYIEAHSNLGNVLQDQGLLDEAIACYRQALAIDPGFADAYCNLGTAFLAQGRPVEAATQFRQAISLQPELAEAHCNLGHALQAQGQSQGQGHLDEAVACYRQALLLKPDYAEAWSNLGNALQVQGRLDEAITHLRQAISLRPDLAEVYCNLGNVLQAQGQSNEAIASFRQAILAKPDYAEAYSNLGHVLQIQDLLDESIACCQKALSLKPDFAEAHSNLGIALQAQGRLEEATAHFRQALLIKPDFAEACSNLGNALQFQGSLDEAVTCCKQAILIKPDFAGAWSNLGNALQDQCKLHEAAAAFRQALLLKPDFAEAHYNLGNALKELGHLDEAISCYRQALLIKPDYVEALSNLGNAFLAQSRLDDSIACYRQALSIKPDYADAHSNLIFALDLKMDVDIQTLQAERQRWGEAFANAFCSTPSSALRFPNHIDPERRLRIGYVSADFREHSAAIGFGAMLTRFDPEMFDVFAYSNSSIEDGHTRLFRQSVANWRKITGLTDSAVADLIRQDGIDILVDLSGHSGGNRLRMFARKPAPIQITAWGYAGGTGIKTMDVLFSDPVIVPPEEKKYYSEEVHYLPSVISAYFPVPFPSVNALPSLSVAGARPAQGVTFGSLNRMAKVSNDAFNVWTQILSATPTSRILLKAPELEDASMRERLTGRFIEAGIDPARISLLGRTSWHDHMVTFNQIDISLDPFPQSGGATTLEGLMMGVPVITLRGNTFVGRGSASLLTTLGMTDWIAETPEQYIEIAARKAQDLTALAELRKQLRPRFMSSVIGDTTAYARAAEAAYRTLWRDWCNRQIELHN